MSLIDPTNPAFWADGSERSEDNGFVLGMSGVPIDWSRLQVNAGRAAKLSTGRNWATMHGMSRRADEILNTGRYSPTIEGREAGQRATERRDAIRKGTI